MMDKYGIISLAASLLIMFCGCTKPASEESVRYESHLVDRVVLPSVISAEEGSVCTITGKGFEEGDMLKFAAGEYDDIVAGLLEVSYSYCSFEVSPQIKSGVRYSVSLLRGAAWQNLGNVTFDIKLPSLEYNVAGHVRCGGKGIEGVWVSDGVAWAKTDSEGCYKMLSQKERKYVFIVSPAGYAPECDGAWPAFWHRMDSMEYSVVEEHDFTLEKVSDNRHEMIFSADWQLRGERVPADYEQAKAIFTELAEYKSSLSVPAYSITLGDETWDVCWKDHGFDLPAFRKYAKDFPLPLYTVIGNHDHNPSGTSDFDSADIYREVMGPTNFAMNIGSVHYIIMDNVIYEPATRGVTERFTKSQTEWLREDLSHVSTDTPVVLCVHVPMHKWIWNMATWTAAPRGSYGEAAELLKQYGQVHIFSGHSHLNEFFDLRASGLSGNQMYEHKVAALGGCMWYTGSLAGYNVSRDGIPSGYEILEADGRNLSWRYKSIGREDSWQFRVHDMNSVKKFWEENGKMANLVASNPEYAYGTLYGSLPEGAVLLNVFRGDPKMKGLRIEVADGNGTLDVLPAFVKDPLVVYASEASWWEKNKSLPSSSYSSTEISHIFYAIPQSGTASIDVTLYQGEVPVSTRKINLPLEFNTDDK